MVPGQISGWCPSFLRLFQTYPCLSVGPKLELSKPNLVFGPQEPMCPCREIVANLFCI